MKISSKVSHWIISLVLVVFFSVSATIIQSNIHAQQQSDYLQNSVSAQAIYGQDGKPDGQLLDSTPEKITQENIFFEDRILTRYHYDAQSIDYTVESLNLVFDWVPDNINQYLMVAPSRIAVEKTIDTADRADSIRAIEEICERINNGVVTVNTMAALSQHADEYIFFRTEKIWTALGAYYAAEAFLSAKNIDMIPIENYYDFFSTDYLGTLRVLDDAGSLYDYPDLVYSYTLKSSSNTQSITAFDNNEYKEYQSPVIATSRGGLDVFIGEYYSHTIIQGDSASSESIVIIGDQYSKVFASWLIPYYQKIILINPLFYNGDANTLMDKINNYNVVDFLVIESQNMFGESMYNTELVSMLTQQD